jgi:hypothetical protein
MHYKNKISIIGICIFLIAFKVALSGIFVQSTLEWTELYSGISLSPKVEQVNLMCSESKKSTVHELYIVHHAIENFNNTPTFVSSTVDGRPPFVATVNILFLKRFPNQLLRPPSGIA